MAGRKSDFTLTRLDDLFSTQEQRDEEKLSKIRDIPLELIDDFPDHPFKVRDDEDMQQLVESSVVCVIHHKFVSCRNGGFEVIFFKAIGIYYRIEQLLIIYIERQVRDNEIVIYVRILLFDFINTTTT